MPTSPARSEGSTAGDRIVVVRDVAPEDVAAGSGSDWARRYRHRHQVESKVAEADLVVASDGDIALLHGPDADPVEVARAWLDLGPAIVVLVRGHEGLLAVRRGGATIEVAAAPPDAAGPADALGGSGAATAALLAWAHERGAPSGTDLTELGDAEVRGGLALAARAAAGATEARPDTDPSHHAERPDA